MKCEVCGGNVEVIGNTTKSYKNLDAETIERLKEELHLEKEKWFTQCRCPACINKISVQQNIIDKQQELIQKMAEVVRFYGDRKHYPTKWGYMKINGDDYYDCDKEYMGHDGALDQWKLTGGKKARELLESDLFKEVVSEKEN